MPEFDDKGYLLEFDAWTPELAARLRVLCAETGFSLKEIYELYPRGPARGACRVAGLPRPDSCV